MSHLKKGTVVKLKNPLLKKTSGVQHVPYHWHVVLEVNEEKVLLLPLSSQPLSKYLSQLPQDSTSWHLDVDPNTDTYNCPNQMKWWYKDMPWLQDGKSSYQLSESEMNDCLDCLYDDLYLNLPDNKYMMPWWVTPKQQLYSKYM
jgi:hypothetical protein